MANQLVSVLLDPQTVASGGQTTATIKYQSGQQDDLLISCSAAFTVAPTKVPLAASANGATQVKVTITRAVAVAPDECTIHFTFLGDERDRIVEVT
jgi:hypothetical protein